MRFAISGGTGFIGSYLAKDWIDSKNEVILLTRDCNRVQKTFPGVTCVNWDEMDENLHVFEKLDAVVHLAGEPINSGRWTKARKQKILHSRVHSTHKVANMIDRLTIKPSVVISGSAVGIYGYSETRRFDEDSEIEAGGFLTQVCQEWEKAADQIKQTRVVKLRTGLVLGCNGGAFPKMLWPYKLGIGGRIGGGKQWMSWIHIMDMVRIIQFCIDHETMEGPVNAVAPNPVTNDEFGRNLATKLPRPHWLPVPRFALQALFGEMSEILLQGQYVYPKKLLDAGFSFKYETISEALQELIPHIK